MNKDMKLVAVFAVWIALHFVSPYLAQIYIICVMAVFWFHVVQEWRNSFNAVASDVEEIKRIIKK